MTPEQIATRKREIQEIAARYPALESAGIYKGKLGSEDHGLVRIVFRGKSAVVTWELFKTEGLDKILEGFPRFEK